MSSVVAEALFFPAAGPHGPSANSFDWAGLREWLIAAGTLGAVIVSLYVSVWTERVRRPSLSLLFSDPPESTDKLLSTTHDDTARAAAVRLRVKNKPRRRTAREVEVLIQRIWAENGERVRVEDWPLRWAWAFSDTGDTPTTVTTVPPGVSRRVLLFWVEETSPGSMSLGNWPDAGQGRDILAAGTWHIRLAVTANDTPSTFWEMTVFSDGTFDDGVLDRIKVSPPKKRPSAS